MAYPPPVTKKERRVLEVIARGHPERIMNISGSFGSGKVNALEWSEIQIAVGMQFEEFGNCIAHLVAGNLIDSGQQRPGILGWLGGKESQSFFWATSLGRRFLVEQSEAATPEEILPPKRSDANGSDIDEAIGIYENSKSHRPYVKPEQVTWATSLLDEDVRSEVERAAHELEEMWNAFEKMFGHRGAVKGPKEAAVRDPAVTRSVVRVYRARDEQRRRRDFAPSPKPEAWASRYNGGKVGLEPAPWE